MDYNELFYFFKQNQNCKIFDLVKHFNLKQINKTGRRQVFSRDDIDFVLKWDSRYYNKEDLSSNLLEYKRSKIINPKYFAKVYKKFGSFLIMEKAVVNIDTVPNKFYEIYGMEVEDLSALMFEIDNGNKDINILNKEAQKLFFECKKAILPHFDFHWSNIGMRPNTAEEIVIIDYGEPMSTKEYNKLKELTK